jgi:hypothetical protein
MNLKKTLKVEFLLPLDWEFVKWTELTRLPDESTILRTGKTQVQATGYRKTSCRASF